jgi:hypothetical protein
MIDGSIVVDPNTFIPFCTVCKTKFSNYPNLNDEKENANDAYDRAMGIVGKR